MPFDFSHICQDYNLSSILPVFPGLEIWFGIFVFLQNFKMP